MFYKANNRSVIFNELKNIVRKTFGVADIIRESLTPISQKISAAFIFGSIARNDDDRASDIDVMIIGDVSFADVSSCISPAEKSIQREINPVVYPTDEFKQKLAEGHHFIKTVLEEKKIFLIGDEDELGRMAESGTDKAAQNQ